MVRTHSISHHELFILKLAVCCLKGFIKTTFGRFEFYQLSSCNCQKEVLTAQKAAMLQRQQRKRKLKRN